MKRILKCFVILATMLIVFKYTNIFTSGMLITTSIFFTTVFMITITKYIYAKNDLIIDSDYSTKQSPTSKIVDYCFGQCISGLPDMHEDLNKTYNVEVGVTDEHLKIALEKECKSIMYVNIDLKNILDIDVKTNFELLKETSLGKSVTLAISRFSLKKNHSNKSDSYLVITYKDIENKIRKVIIGDPQDVETFVPSVKRKIQKRMSYKLSDSNTQSESVDDKRVMDMATVDVNEDSDLNLSLFKNKYTPDFKKVEEESTLGLNKNEN